MLDAKDGKERVKVMRNKKGREQVVCCREAEKRCGVARNSKVLFDFKNRKGVHCAMEGKNPLFLQMTRKFKRLGGKAAGVEGGAPSRVKIDAV